jgi:SAM-dependent MidA family methyltransferase
VTLRHKIEHEIHQRGPIPFSRYMDLCLYDPQLGYYSRNAEQFGKAGDFYTSSDVHAVFGRLMARQFEEMWRVLGSPEQIEVVELGPGRGLFAQDVLDWSEKKFPEFFDGLHYSLEERSPALRMRLQATLSEHFKSGKVSLPQRLKPPSYDGSYGTAEAVPSRDRSDVFDVSPKQPRESTTSQNRDELLDTDRTGKGTTAVVPNNADFARALAPEVPVIVFANEFFDALPVEVLSERGKLHISEKERRFVETWSPASPEELEFLDRYSVHPETGDRVEVPLIAQRWMTQIAATVKSGFIIAIDYGYTRQEQLTGRHRGTIAAYRQHSVSANPYEAPGEQDITAHVNFTALAAAAEQSGMKVEPLLTQSQFLLGIGEPNQFADAFEDCQVPQERAKVALQLKHLVTPAGMGEGFWVLVASKGISKKQLSKLSGLSFGKPAAL